MRMFLGSRDSIAERGSHASDALKFGEFYGSQFVSLHRIGVCLLRGTCVGE